MGLDSGDDAAVVRIQQGTALIATTDFFTPVVDDAYDWGRIAAAMRCPTCTRWAGARWSR